MATSLVSGMKMKNFLVGVIFGLLAAVHSTPVNNVIFTEGESDVLQEAMKDEFLILSLNTQSPKRNTTVQQASSDSKESDMIESSPAWDSTSRVLSRNTDDSRSDPSNTPSPQSTVKAIMQKMFLDHPYSVLTSDLGSGDGEMLDHHSASGSSITSSRRIEANSALSTSTAPPMFTGSEGSGSASGTSDDSESATAEKAVMQKVFLDHSYSVLTSDLGSGDGQMLGQYLTTSSSMTSSPETEASTALSTTTAPPMFIGSEGSVSEISTELSESVIAKKQSHRLESQERPVNHASPQSTGHSTPSWIIILAFIVGVAALVIVCVAIATREKWNGPNQVSQLETKTDSSNQQGEQEMKTLLHKDKPRENGKAGEYTIIPLDELSQSYTSH